MISIVIVTHNSAEWIEGCLGSLSRTGAEVIVVDNASTDGTPDRIRNYEDAGVRLVTQGRNLGFAAACNLGARESSGELLLFLNPDTRLRSALSPLEELFEQRPQVAAAGAQLVDASGRPQTGFMVRRFPTLAALLFEVLLINRLAPSNPVNRRYRCLDLDPSRPAAVEQPSGAFLMVRRSAFDAASGFDERFHPLWFEDVDLCLRLRRAGGVIRYEPCVVAEHAGGHSLGSETFSDKQVYWYCGMLYYVRKNLGLIPAALVRVALLAGCGLRIVGELVGGILGRKSFAGPRGPRLRAYWQAARLSWSGLQSGSHSNVPTGTS